MQFEDVLIQNIDKIHTTKLGMERIKRNLDLKSDDVVNWCKQKVEQTDEIIRKGKNWYVYADNLVITVNAHSYTIITAHKNIKSKMTKRFITLFFVIGVFVAASAQTIQVNARFDSTAIMIGDQIKLRIELERQNDVRVQFPAWTDALTRNIEIIEVYPVDSTRTAEGTIRLKQDILVTSFDSGRHVLPPIRFPFVADGHADTIATRPIFLDVYIMPLDSTQNIADIKPIYKVPIGWADIWPWLWRIGLLLVVAAIIAFAIYAIIRRRHNKPIFSAPKPAEPPHITALRELDRLRGEKLWQNNRTKDYYTRLSDIVRTYIEGRFDVAAMEMTSDEILADLRNTGFEDNNLVDRLRKLFSLSDLVKFAKAEPFPDENETSMLDGYLFVNNTKIEVVAEPEDSEKEKDTDDKATDVEEKSNEK